MKTDIHPKGYRKVIFKDTSANVSFLIGSTVKTEGTDKWTDGNEYPVKEMSISSASHPFYTGQEKVMDTAGRVEKFKAKMSKVVSRKAK
ncbi:50S ribosomal protein L31 [Candidatus Kaiserbacteria bacterium RIFCSPHIGHO2_02_FULL_49_34]|uniref:Large ribosomal subunit protein bL31B n=1 Tax=Candidatus Kaiserbacteria bacterium RIFCSPHIGHO2_02_FULL_49_34 TaxID=1798491 RepID=A0A1F6DJR5_9BACT|nr:MAG: 50S ribosomal protein L31 [Candidatus Kaiserbacteria bacterium RIFCSPHIGHO2_02_FULL_49_34]